MIYISLQIDDETPEIIELDAVMDPKGFSKLTEIDEDRATMRFDSYALPEQVRVNLRQYQGTDYCLMGHARTSFRWSHYGDGAEQIGLYTWGVFQTREEAEAFDKSTCSWEEDPTRGGRQLAKL